VGAGLPRVTDAQVQRAVGGLLRGGVLLAASVVLVGGILFLARHGGARPDYRVFHGEPLDLRGLAGTMRDVVALRGRGIVQLGVLLLIATPVARVALTAVAFAFERDRIYVVVALIVLGLLLLSLLG
jgi:uncharacterized membrane protein